MSKEEIIQLMADSEGMRIHCVETDGEEWTGIVDVYESDCDNEDDERQGHSICVTLDNGTRVIVYDDEISYISAVS